MVALAVIRAEPVTVADVVDQVMVGRAEHLAVLRLPLRAGDQRNKAVMVITPILDVRHQPTHHPPWVKTKSARPCNHTTRTGGVRITGGREILR